MFIELNKSSVFILHMSLIDEYASSCTRSYWGKRMGIRTLIVHMHYGMNRRNTEITVTQLFTQEKKHTWNQALIEENEILRMKVIAKKAMWILG